MSTSGGEGTRTLGLRLAKPPLFQLSYTPEPRTALGVGNRGQSRTADSMLGRRSDDTGPTRRRRPAGVGHNGSREAHTIEAREPHPDGAGCRGSGNHRGRLFGNPEPARRSPSSGSVAIDQPDHRCRPDPDGHLGTDHDDRGPHDDHVHDEQAPATSPPTTTTVTTTPATTPAALGAPAPGFVAGHVTAVGDSVMLDYQTPLEADIPGVDVEAAVSEQWGAGEEELSQLKAEGRLGAEVIVALSTNGPITATDFANMMNVLSGASHVVFVNIHVDRPWQDPNNAVLAQGAAGYPRVVIADWATLAAANPEWFGPDGTHLAIDGTGAQALASLIATTLSNG